MTLAMAAFAVEDALIKSLSGTLATGQIVAVIGGGGGLLIALWLRATGQSLWSAQLATPPALWRLFFEVVGTAAFTTSLALIPLTTASAVIQATPLIVAMGGAVFLAQPVGWRRWTAIGVGFAGVLLVLRPGLDGFQPATLLAVLGMLCLAGRDLATRRIGGAASGLHLSLAAFLALVPTGLVMARVTGPQLVWPAPWDAALLALCVAIGLIGYLAIVGATRAGDVAVTASFRYSRMVFAGIIGFAVFGERPDAMTLLGITIVIGAGLFVLIRERRALRGASPRAHEPV